MKINIRKGLFETNSSSMHSIVISKNEGLYDFKEITKHEIYICNYPNKGGVYDLQCVDDNTFGRYPFRVLTDFEDKLVYAIAEYCCSSDDDKNYEKFKEIEKIVKKYIPEINEIKLGEKAVTRYIDANGNILKDDEIYFLSKELDNVKSSGEYYIGPRGGLHKAKKVISYVNDYGYIDGGGVLYKFLKDKNVSLEEFLTHKQYWIIIDGDEYWTWDSLKKAGVIDLNNIAYDSSEDKHQTEDNA